MNVAFFDIEKAYNTLWREGLLIKRNKIGIGGNPILKLGFRFFI